jgi:hypothetical protein
MTFKQKSKTYLFTEYVGGHSPSKRSYTDTGLGVHDDVLYVEEDEHGNVLSTYTAQVFHYQ